MNERRPPPRPLSAPKPMKGRASIDSTVLAPRPSFTDEGFDDDSGPVFGTEAPTPDASSDRTHTMKAPGKRAATPTTDDISLIEAKELKPAPSDGGFGFQPHTTANEADSAIDDGIAFDEGYSPATEVLRLAFSDPAGESVTPAEPMIARPQHDPELEDLPTVEVKKWRAGGGERPPQAGPAPGPPSFASRGGVVMHVPEQPSGTRVDHVAPGRGAQSLDVVELRRTLEEAEKLLRTVKHQASALDLDLVAPGARGMNAQLAAALHRLGEALAMLGK